MYWWDEKKRKFNLAKHGIDFRDAAKVFDGPLVTVEDTREDYGEARYIALGLLEGAWFQWCTRYAAAPSDSFPFAKP